MLEGCRVVTEQQGKCPNCGKEGNVGARCPGETCLQQGFFFIARMFADTQSLGVLGRDPLIGKKIDEYLVVRKLGEGGFGAVYLALQMPIMMKTALKLIKGGSSRVGKTDAVDSFLKEAQALASLHHPNIVRLIKYGEFEGVPYLVTEFVKDGRELSDLVEERAASQTGFTLEEIRHVMTQLLGALAAAHEEGFIHRDIKPANIMIQPMAGDPLYTRVLDFGLAKFLEASPDTTMARGTPTYMAPEQFTGRDIGPWTDLYAAALILFELLTGRRAFEPRQSTELLAMKLNPDHDPTHRAADLDLPKVGLDFVRKAASTDHTHRYRSAEEFLGAMNAAFATLAAMNWHGPSPEHVALMETGTATAYAGERQDHRAVPQIPTGNDETMVDYSTQATHVSPPMSPPDSFQASLQFATAVGKKARPPEPPVRQPRDEPDKQRPARSVRPLIWAGLAAGVLVATALVLYLVAGKYFGVEPAGKQEKPESAQEETAPDRVVTDGEFCVTGTVKHDQEWPWVFARPDGSFVVAWQSDHQDGSGGGIYARNFGPDGAKGEEYLVNSHTAGNQTMPRVAGLSNGRYVVVWASELEDSDGWGIYGQLYDSDGVREKPPFRINAWTAGDQGLAAVASIPEHGFLVVWQSYGQDGDAYGIYAQLFQDNGNRLGEERQLNEQTKGKQRFPAVTSGSSGYLVAWESEGQDGDGYGVYGRILGMDGLPTAGEFLVNAHTKGSQRWPAVAPLGKTQFLATWTSEGQDGSGRGVYARALGAAGKPASEEFKLNETNLGHQWIPQAAAIDDARCVVFWMSDGQDGSGYGVAGRLATRNGPEGKEFVLNSFVEADQRVRAVAGMGDGRFVGLWESDGQDGSGWGVFAVVRKPE